MANLSMEQDIPKLMGEMQMFRTSLYLLVTSVLASTKRLQLVAISSSILLNGQVDTSRQR